LRCSANPWFFVNEEMLRYAKMLSPKKLSDFEVAKAIYQMVRGRFEIKVSSLKPWSFYRPEPSCEVWQKAEQSPMKVSFVLLSMLLLSERFEDARLCATTRKYGIFTRPHYYVRLKIGKKEWDLDVLAYELEPSNSLAKETQKAEILVNHPCKAHLKIGENVFHMCGMKNFSTSFSIP